MTYIIDWLHFHRRNKLAPSHLMAKYQLTATLSISRNTSYMPYPWCWHLIIWGMTIMLYSLFWVITIYPWVDTLKFLLSICFCKLSSKTLQGPVQGIGFSLLHSLFWVISNRTWGKHIIQYLVAHTVEQIEGKTVQVLVIGIGFSFH